MKKLLPNIHDNNKNNFENHISLYVIMTNAMSLYTTVRYVPKAPYIAPRHRLKNI